MRQDISDLKTIVLELLQNQTRGGTSVNTSNPAALKRLFQDAPQDIDEEEAIITTDRPQPFVYGKPDNGTEIAEHEEYEESLSLEDTERELIQKALRRHNKRRKNAAKELGISERILYRKIKKYNLK